MPVKPAGDKYFSAIDKRIDIKGLSSTYLVNSGMPYPARYSVKDLIAVGTVRRSVDSVERGKPGRALFGL